MAKNFWKKAFGPLGGNDDEEYYDEEEMMEDQYGEDSYEDEPERQEPAYEEPSFSRRRSKVISMPENRTSASGDTQMKMIIFRPTSYDETQSVIDSLKARKPIIVNLDEIDVRLKALRGKAAPAGVATPPPPRRAKKTGRPKLSDFYDEW